MGTGALEDFTQIEIPESWTSVTLTAPEGSLFSWEYSRGRVTSCGKVTGNYGDVLEITRTAGVTKDAVRNLIADVLSQGGSYTCEAN